MLFLWDVAVLEHDSHPNHKKGPDQAQFGHILRPTCLHRSLSHYIADHQLFDGTTFIWIS